MDDDDIFTTDAFTKIRKASRQNPGHPLVFRMITPPGEVVWTEQRFERGNTGTPMIVVPNVRELLLQHPWGTRQGADVRFMEEISLAFEKRGNPVVWREEVVCVCRPTVQLK